MLESAHEPRKGAPPREQGDTVADLSFALRDTTAFDVPVGERNLTTALNLLIAAGRSLNSEIIDPAEVSIETLLADRRHELWRWGKGLVHLPDSGIAYITSDLEGRYSRLKEYFSKTEFLERVAQGEDLYFCILGDLVDRGPEQVALIEYLTDLKRDPLIGPRLIVLVGTHEWDSNQNWKLTGHGGFFHHVIDHPAYKRCSLRDPLLQEVVECYLQGIEHADLARAAEDRGIWKHAIAEGDEFYGGYLARRVLYHMYHSLFEELPRCIITESGLFMSHGGIPVHHAFRESEPRTRADYLSVLGEADAVTTRDLVWSVYSPEVIGLAQNPRGTYTADPLDGPAGVAFGPDALQTFLQRIGCSYFIHGHNPNPPEGVKPFGGWMWEHGLNMCITANSGSGCLRVDLSKRIPFDPTGTAARELISVVRE